MFIYACYIRFFIFFIFQVFLTKKKAFLQKRTVADFRSEMSIDQKLDIGSVDFILIIADLVVRQLARLSTPHQHALLRPQPDGGGITECAFYTTARFPLCAAS